MDNHSQGASLSSTANPPTKRRRGRPRIDDNIQGDSTALAPPSDNLKNKQSVGTSLPTSDDMVGQMVSGVIEGSFDAGYLLSVKVGDTDRHLRGIVFLPGRLTPITAENDVAPDAKMYERKEIPIPSVNSQGHLHATSPSGKSENLVEHKNDAPNLPEQGLHIGLQFSATTASESQSASILIPPVSNFPFNDTGHPLGKKNLPEQILDPGVQNDKVVGQDQSLLGSEASELMKGPNINVEALNVSEPVSATFTTTLPATETVNLKPQVEDKAIYSDLIPQELFHDDTEFEASKLMKGPNINVEALNASERVSAEFTANLPVIETVNLNPQVEERVICSDLKPQELFLDDAESLDLGNSQTPKLSEPEPQANASEPTRTNILEKQSPSRQDIDVSQDTELELATKSICGAGTSHMDLLSAREATTSIPSEPKPTTEECLLPKMDVPVMAADTKSVESNEKDGIPLAQS
ncbi:hypothetical protein HRI_002817000 [Hibiscus trionum]|uniref:AT hook motif-containing protein n=1 Tax=Hibiscus trionum TaxID=183268 RepID=A0A9W7I9Z8_HIBTR|nr:hypothetical protein HRI_002817000 [Hibiscus trionum]